MSRSIRAWARGCELVGAAVPSARRVSGREVVRDHLAVRRLVRTAPSLAALTWVTASVVLMLAFDPAVASGKPVNRKGRVPATRAAQGASHIAVALIKHNSPPSDSSDGSGRPGRTRAQLLAFGSGYASPHGSGAVRALQRRLAGLSYATGPVDGRFGPRTEQAVRRFQAGHGLIVDGIDGPATRKALASARLVLRPGDGYVPGGSGPVRALQRHLAAAGFSPGPIDGRYGPLTERAVRRFQAARHLPVDGTAGPQTLGRLRHAPRRQVHHRPSPRNTTPARPRSTTTPARPRSTTPPHPARPNTRHRGGASLVPWLILLACLLLVGLAGLLWHGRRRRDGRVRAAPTDADERVEPVPEVVAAPATERAHAPPRPDLPDDPAAADGVFRLAQTLAQTGRPAPAIDALRRAEGLGHPDAAFELGLMLAHEGDLAGAQEALVRAHEQGHPDAAFELGELFERQGDPVSAEQAYRVGDERGHARAAFNLGVLLWHDRDAAGAEDAFRRADERGHPGGASNLGVLLEEHGDVAGARAAYERADGRGEAVGAYNLGLLLEQAGDTEDAKAAFDRAFQRGEPAAALMLGRLLEREGDRDGARSAFQRAGQLGPPEVAEFAHAELRALQTDSEEPER